MECVLGGAIALLVREFSYMSREVSGCVLLRDQQDSVAALQGSMLPFCQLSDLQRPIEMCEVREEGWVESSLRWYACPPTASCADLKEDNRVAGPVTASMPMALVIHALFAVGAGSARRRLGPGRERGQGRRARAIVRSIIERTTSHANGDTWNIRPGQGAC